MSAMSVATSFICARCWEWDTRKKGRKGERRLFQAGHSICAVSVACNRFPSSDYYLCASLANKSFVMKNITTDRQHKVVWGKGICLTLPTYQGLYLFFSFLFIPLFSPLSVNCLLSPFHPCIYLFYFLFPACVFPPPVFT